MIEQTTLARPYAKAAFEWALSKQQVSEWGFLLFVLKTALENSAVLCFLETKTIHEEKKVNFLLDICKACQLKFDDTLKHFLWVLSENKRLTVLPCIQQQYKKRQMAFEHKIDVELETAVPIDSETAKHYEKILSDYFKREAVLSHRLAPALLGGFVAKAGDTVIDGSLLGELTALKDFMGA